MPHNNNYKTHAIKKESSITTDDYYNNERPIDRSIGRPIDIISLQQQQQSQNR